MTNRFYLVDVFAEQAYTGNPLAVIVGRDDLTDATRQQIAAEMNFSETTFVTPESEADAFRVRIFTPSQEIAFAGHPILGTAWIIRQYLLATPAATVVLKLAVGDIPVSFESHDTQPEVVWFRAPAVTLGPICDRKAMAAAIGVSENDLDPDFPVQQCAATTSAMLVPVRSLAVLNRSRLDLARYAPLTAHGFPPLTYVFCRETHHPHNDLCVRFFFEAHGVREDPATGNGAAFLGAYLLQYPYFSGSQFDLRIEQGYELRRPSLVRLRAQQRAGNREINVGGHVVPVAQGELR
jgi:trans-2,3-dihydro-3-hydroxyanthranilate isomerase